MSKPSLHIAFVAGGAPFHGNSPAQGALGGSETAVVQMAGALRGLGHRVEVFCHCPRPGDYGGVVYRDLSQLVADTLGRQWHVLVISRDFAALDLPIESGLTVLWNHDVLDRPLELQKRLHRADLLWVLSGFHAENFAKRLPACREKLALTKNGLDLQLVQKAIENARPQAGLLAYASRPERGLKLLLQEIWPRLSREVPGLRLALCGYQVRAEGLPAKIQEEYRQIDELVAARDDVMSLGALSKPDYYQFLASCQALLYPCTFPEISCITALEAQALGTPILTSDSFALSETVRSREARVPGRPGSPPYLREYLDRALKLLREPEAARQAARIAQREVLAEHGWASIAAQWEAHFLSLLQQRRQAQSHELAAALALQGDRAAASQLLASQPPLGKEGPPPPDPDEAATIKQIVDELAPHLAALPLARLGVLSADQGRTALALARSFPKAEAIEITDAICPASLDALLVRDRLEREADPAAFLAGLLPLLKPRGRLLLATAHGAWPLAAPGHAARLHNLGESELRALLPGRDLSLRFVPQARVKAGQASFLAGRWLAHAAAAGPPPGPLDRQAPLWRTRPVSPELAREAAHAGLF